MKYVELCVIDLNAISLSVFEYMASTAHVDLKKDKHWELFLSEQIHLYAALFTSFEKHVNSVLTLTY